MRFVGSRQALHAPKKGPLANFRAAYQAAKANIAGPLVINCVGDSTISGIGGGNPSSFVGNNARGNSFGEQLATALAAKGLSVNGADFFGNGLNKDTYTTAQYAAFNTAITSIGSWAFAPTLYSLSGNLWNDNSGTTAMSWNAEGRTFDTLTVFYPSNDGAQLGTFRVLLDGATLDTITPDMLAKTVRSKTYTVSRGTHSVGIQRVSGGCYFIGMEVIDSATKNSVRVRNIGWGGASSNDINDTTSVGFASGVGLSQLSAAHLHILQGGIINDMQQTGTITTAVTLANMTSMADKLQAKGGDVLFMGATRANTATITGATQDAYIIAMLSAANGRTRVFKDVKDFTGDYATMNAASRMFDNFHPNMAGYGAQSSGFANWLDGL